MLGIPQAPAGADSGERPKSPRTRPRSSLGVTPKLSPSPAFLEPSKISKDDSFLTVTPSTPKRETGHTHGLSLQMPPKDTSTITTNNLSSSLLNINPLSPKLDTSPYGSPTSALPRRSRGMDYSRACTNLHYSTLAEQSSPDSSPVVGGRPMKIPSRKNQHSASNSTNVPDSPGSGAASLWSTVGNGEKLAIASSAGSVNMLDSDDASSSSEDEDAIMGQVDDEDTIHGTPQAAGLRNPFLHRSTSSPSRDGHGPFLPSAASLMSFRHARLRHHRSRKSSSSVSGRSSLTSPAPGSPPLLKSVEGAPNPSHCSRTREQSALDSRRQSLSLGTNELCISDMFGLDEIEPQRSPCDALGLPLPANPFDERRNVIRKAVTRGRGNLLVRTPFPILHDLS